MYMRLYYVMALMCVAIGCNSNANYRYHEANFDDEREAIIQQVGEELEIGIPYDLCKEGTYLYVLAYTPDCWLHIYDIKTGSKVSDAIRVGRGPGEGVRITSMDYFAEEQNLFVFDTELHKTLVYHLDGNTGQATFEKEIQHPLEGVIRKCHHLGNELYLYEGYLPGDDNNTRFTLSDGKKALDTYNIYPDVSREYDRVAFLQANTKGVPDTDAVVSGTFYGAVLECFHISKNHIEPTAIRLLEKPEMDESSSTVDIKAGSKYGFLTLCPTQDYIYATYINSTNPGDLRSIVSFDWKGREKIKYTADRNIFRLCPGDKRDELFGISISPEHECFLIKIYLE